MSRPAGYLERDPTNQMQATAQGYPAEWDVTNSEFRNELHAIAAPGRVHTALAIGEKVQFYRFDAASRSLIWDVRRGFHSWSR